jgi:hypothetical protein
VYNFTYLVFLRNEDLPIEIQVESDKSIRLAKYHDYIKKYKFFHNDYLMNLLDQYDEYHSKLTTIFVVGINLYVLI